MATTIVFKLVLFLSSYRLRHYFWYELVMKLPPLAPPFAICFFARLPVATAFTGTTASVSTTRTSVSSTLHALTERQQQFWEDVESGLDDIEEFYKSKKGLDIDRIRQFGRR